MTAPTPPGWYPIPGDPSGQLRYWDGAAWTNDVSAPVAPSAPLAGHTAPKAKGKKWPWIAGGVVAVFIIGGIASAANGGDSAAKKQTATALTTSRGSGSSAASASASRTSATPTSSPPPAPTRVPAPSRSYSGNSDDVISFTSPQTIAAQVAANYNGLHNFVIEALDASGQETALLVNTIGAYSGTTLLPVSGSRSVSALKITASGPWTLTVADLFSGTKWAGTNPAAGQGDMVLVVDGGTPKLQTIKVVNIDGLHNFIMSSYTASGSYTNLVNQIGPWSGTELLPAGTVLVVVQGTGHWTITP